MSVPVIFVSKTIGIPCAYLREAMSVASRANEEVILLGDEGNKDFCVGKYFPYEEYLDSYKKFESLYVHLSTIHPEIEKFCFSRWFIIREFMERNNLTQVLHLDTDILFFANSNEEGKRFSHLDCALTGRTSGHSSYWTYEGLCKFCDYVIELYENKDNFDFQRLASIFTLRQKYGLDGGVCDMSVLEHYARYKAPHLVGELSIVSENLYYDHIIGTDEGFTFRDGRKEFEYRQGVPHAFHEKTKRLIPFATIHFQGTHNKHLIKHHHDISLQH